MKTEEVVEELKLQGQKALKKLEALIKEGNVRKVVIRNSDGKKLATFRLNIGVVAVLCAPLLAFVATIVAVCSDCTATIVKDKKSE
jgi:hypothetical protein